MDSKKIGLFISKKRHELNLTQEELANILYVSSKTISKWETGRGMPSIELLEPLANTLNISIAEILSGGDTNKEKDVLIKELKIKSKKNKINLIVGIIICLFLCILEVILYIAKVDELYAYIIFGLFIIILLIIDITNYYLNK